MTAATALAPSEFLAFANVGEAIAATPAKLEKVRLLVRIFARRWITRGSRSPRFILPATLFRKAICARCKSAGSVIYRALAGATKMSDAEFRRIATSHGDAGKTAFEVLDGRTSPEPFGLIDSHEFFEQLHKSRGPVAKNRSYCKIVWRVLLPREGQYVVKILTGDLRIGLREGLVEEAIAKAFAAALDEVKEANMLLGDIGRTAVLAKRQELHRAELTLFRPIKCMLASPEPTAEAIWKRFVESNVVAAVASVAGVADPGPASAMPATVYVEDKFDGIRAQLHRE